MTKCPKCDKMLSDKRSKFCRKHRIVPTFSEEYRKRLSEAHIGKYFGGGFKKGNIPWNKGTNGVMKPNSGSFKKGMIPWIKGRGHSEEARERISKGYKYHVSPHNFKEGHEPWNKDVKGIHLSPETEFKKGREGAKGEKSPNWKGGTSSLRARAYCSKEYQRWREKVFARDDFRCLDCGKRGGELNADHIYPWSLFPRLRLMLENGRTLCVACHRKTDTYGYKSVNRSVLQQI